jgi:hypothetical protein
MLRWLLMALLQRVLILIGLVAVSCILPVASFWLVRDPVEAQVVFWASPWVVAFWSLIAHVFVGSRFWRGREAVLAWRAERGGYVRSCMKSTGVMFGALAMSYALELAVVFFVPPSATARQLFPLITYAPAVFTFWRAARG